MCAESMIEGVDIIIADVNDQESLEAMCAKANVLINCVGPVRYYVKVRFSLLETCYCHE